MHHSDVSFAVDAAYRANSRRVYAALIRLLGDYDLAEDALHEAFKAAVEQWPAAGIPANPVAWLVSAGRFKAIDGIRRRARFEPLDVQAQELLAAADSNATERDQLSIEDERLRLIFTCCHPAISADAQVALTLREVCGLTTEEISHAFLVPAPTLAQRIVRAKTKIRDARIPFDLPTAGDLGPRLQSVLRVVYLVFNEGYSASSGEVAQRSDLAAEAIRLARLLAELLAEPETQGLLALMLLHESRRGARTSAAGDLIPLDEQDRGLWDRALIREGAALVESSLRSRRFGPYTLQAAISAIHAQASSYAETDWSEIVGVYEALVALEPSAVVSLNLAVAIAMRDGPAAGIPRVEALLAEGELQSYHLAHAARADLYRRLGDVEQARASYQMAITLSKQEPEKRFLQRKLNEVAAH
jgi:RNA polymerase sigma-70 factor (ECF subfamily)